MQMEFVLSMMICKKMYLKFIEADGVIVASPLVLYGCERPVKGIYRPLSIFWSRKYLLNQPIREGG